MEVEKFPPSSDSFWIPNSKPSSLHGSASTMVNFDVLQQEITNERPRLETSNTNEEYQPEKKRRLSRDQVHFLERSFEVENKLEPERKMHLAKQLGLQPRQVAIWFQNRRARYRTKHIEKEFGSLKASYDQLSADFDAISKENEILRHKVQMLTEKLKSKEKGDPIINPIEAEQPHKQQSNITSTTILPDKKPLLEASSSAKSDVLDSESPHCTDAINQFLEPANSSHVFESSDFSHEEDDGGASLFQTLSFPKLDQDHQHELQQITANSCNLGFPISDQTSFWFWNSGLVD